MGRDFSALADGVRFFDVQGDVLDFCRKFLFERFRKGQVGPGFFVGAPDVKGPFARFAGLYVTRIKELFAKDEGRCDNALECGGIRLSVRSDEDENVREGAFDAVGRKVEFDAERAAGFNGFGEPEVFAADTLAERAFDFYGFFGDVCASHPNVAKFTLGNFAQFVRLGHKAERLVRKKG